MENITKIIDELEAQNKALSEESRQIRASVEMLMGFMRGRSEKIQRSTIEEASVKELSAMLANKISQMLDMCTGSRSNAEWELLVLALRHVAQGHSPKILTNNQLDGDTEHYEARADHYTTSPENYWEPGGFRQAATSTSRIMKERLKK